MPEKKGACDHAVEVDRSGSIGLSCWDIFGRHPVSRSDVVDRRGGELGSRPASEAKKNPA